MNNALDKKEGPCVVLAGAGTGKTHTIVEKIKNLIKGGFYRPEKMVCITFSNEAANSLKTRLLRELSEINLPIVETFHSFSADLLRKHGSKIEINNKFSILTPDEAKVILNRNFKVTPYYCHKYISAIGTAKDLGIKLEDLQSYVNKKFSLFTQPELEKKLYELQFDLQTLHVKNGTEDKKDRKHYLLKEIKNISSSIDLRKFVNTWSAYEKIKIKHNYQDYSDLNANALSLLIKFPEISSEFSYIVVDEFQDTNKMQLDFLIHLADHRNIMIVGDMNQSIYRFRGAYKDNFSNFKKHFNVKPEDIFALDKSYRSPNSVLRAAHFLIKKNYDDPAECLFVENISKREGEKISIFQMKNGHEEARKVLEIIEAENKRGVPLEEICVMFRTHQQGRILKRALESAGVPFYSITKKSLFTHRSIKSAIDYLVILDLLSRKLRGGEQAWWDIFYQSRFSEEDIIKIGKFMKDNRESENLSVLLINSFEKIGLSEAGKLSTKILVDRFNALLQHKDKNINELIKEIYRIAGLVPEGNTKDENSTIMNLNKFFELAEHHSALYSPDLASFVHYLEILKNLGIEIEASEAERGGVRLMTLHATKGLEYNTVIITNMAQKRFPIDEIKINTIIPLELYPDLSELKVLSEEEKEIYARDYESYHQLMEERRLCYVAFTRTKERLFISYASDYAKKKHYPSQFLTEIDYKNNTDCLFTLDDEEKYVIPEAETKSAFNLVKNEETIAVNVGEKKDSKSPEIVFSPSALLLFDECQKKYEYKYVFNMPEEKTISWDAIRLGSFIHLILDNGVKSEFKDVNQFLNLARQMKMEDDWESVDIDDAEKMIKVFFERNKNKYSSKSLTEQHLRTEIGGFKFLGFADRIDFRPDGIEIVDYKTGRAAISPKHRNWQLGYYAIATSKFGKVKVLTLDMLKHEKPLEFVLDDNGTAKAANSNRMEFNIEEIKNELVSTAEKIVDSYKSGFKACPLDKNCDFCNEYVYRN